MAIRAKKLKVSEMPGKTRLYEVRDSRDITVEEEQADGSLDRVILEYHVAGDDVGYFAKEYRPEGVPKEKAKVIDITALMVDHGKKSVSWYLYDIKDSLAGENTAVGLYNQWSFGLRYLEQSILDQLQGYSAIPELGVIIRNYDEARMERLRDRFQKQCDDIENYPGRMTLAQQKKRIEIVKYRGYLRAIQAILDRVFQPESGNTTYSIHIRNLSNEVGKIYQMRFPV